jgi:hypothetical protein
MSAQSTPDEQTRRIEKLEEKLGKAEEKIIFLDKIVWVCITLGMILFGSAGFLVNLINTAKTDISTIEEKNKTVKKEMEQLQRDMANLQTIDKDLAKRIEPVKQQAITATTQSINNYSKEAITTTKDVLGQSVKDAKASLATHVETLKAPERKAEEDAQLVTKVLNKLKDGTQTIAIKQIEVKNNKGATVASLFSDDDGDYFRLFNKEGGAIISLFTKGTDLHGYINISDSNGNMRAAIFSDRDGGNILVNNKDGKLSARLVTTTESSGQFALYNQKGDMKVQIFSTVDDGYINLFNAGGQALVDMGYYTDTKKPYIRLNKKRTRPIIILSFPRSASLPLS